MSNTPSDEELIAELEAAGVAFMAFRGGAGLTKEIWTTSGSQDAKKIATGIRAVLAKWGTPPVMAGEPVAWRVHPFDHGIGSQGVYAITSLPQQRDAWLRKGWKVEPLYNTPQPVVREPLTDEQCRFLWRSSEFRGNGGQIDWFMEGIRAAERAHGITQKGGSDAE